MNGKQELSIKLLEFDIVVSALTIEVIRHGRKSTNHAETIKQLDQAVKDKKDEIKTHVDYMAKQSFEAGFDAGLREGHNEAGYDAETGEYTAQGRNK